MVLTIRDRVIILNTVLPQFDTRKNMELKLAIGEKLKFSLEENNSIVTSPAGNGQIEISFKTTEAITGQKEYGFTPEELRYLKDRVNFIDQNGMFSADTMATYDKILDAELPDAVK